MPEMRRRAHLRLQELVRARSHVRDHNLPNTLILLRKLDRLLHRLLDRAPMRAHRLHERAFPSFGLRTLVLPVRDEARLDLLLDDFEEGGSSAAKFAGDDEGEVVWDIVGAVIFSDCEVFFFVETE